jgi:hypothetical protein
MAVHTADAPAPASQPRLLKDGSEQLCFCLASQTGSQRSMRQQVSFIWASRFNTQG